MSPPITCWGCRMSREAIRNKKEGVSAIFEAIAIVADVTGILSFVLMVVLLVRSEKLRSIIISQKQAYSSERKRIQLELATHRDGIIKDDMLNLLIISNLRTHLLSVEQKFNYLNTKEDKKHISAAISILDAPINKIDKRLLCKELDYILARFERSEFHD